MSGYCSIQPAFLFETHAFVFGTLMQRSNKCNLEDDDNEYLSKQLQNSN